jgi:ABC-type bacteriocin/lantibiotic exporter with double-glycine peptidase domain
MMDMMWKAIRLTLAIFISLFFTHRCTGGGTEGPYCGVYALYGAAKAVGKDIELRDLISEEYISSNLGSTSTDLQAAARDIGLSATAVRGLGQHSLRHADGPLILHVDPPGI